MAKFCIHCGKKLEDGEVCNCRASQNVVANGNMGTDMLEVLKGMFARPIDTLKAYTDGKHFSLALILLGILAIVTALFTCSLVKNSADALFGSFGSASLYSMAMTQVEVSYLKVFFTALVVFIIFVFIYTGLLYLVNSVIFKGEKDFKKVFTMYGIVSVISSVTLLVSSIFMFVHFALGFIVLALGMLLNMVYTYKGIEFLGVKDQNKHGYIYLLTAVFYAIVLAILMLILS